MIPKSIISSLSRLVTWLVLFISVLSKPFSDPIDQQYRLSKESLTLEQGRSDYFNRKNEAERKGLLCATFTHSNIENSDLMRENIGRMGLHCDWAIIFYNGTSDGIQYSCGKLNAVLGNVVHCARSPSTHPLRITKHPKTNSTIILSTPKSVLYHDLLPYLPYYRRVFTLDDDISLSDFDYGSFLCLWEHSFQPIPLIVQPLVLSQPPQYLTYVNHHPWQKPDRRDVYAAGVGLVEQQVPFFDAEFFEWYVRRVLGQTKYYSWTYGADWGHDRTWCRAAHSWSRYVLGRTEQTIVPCALLTRATPVYHVNLRTMQNKRQHRDLFRSNANQVLQKYAAFFPHWTSLEAIRPNNPFDKKLRAIYPWLYNHTAADHCLI